MQPRNVVVSVGPNNYGHPTGTALNLYRKVGAAVFRTDLQGTVTVTVQPGGAYRITTEKGAATPAAVPVKPGPTPAPVVPAAPANVTYANCAAVRAAGKSPLLRGQPGYSSQLDRDGDGRACE
ncbi:excalibur calcium-binding domain-containing protein [Deinococcus sp. 12RED42]|uniref:excalibur calcium-binding domain-containing protein n=1 Tax=Deinococcus sp. 12RED42 TaxID=2745872 RepID=UPI001E5DD71F